MKSPHAETMFNTSYINIAMDMVIDDAEATGHSLLPGTSIQNQQPKSNPLTINLPYGTQLK